MQSDTHVFTPSQFHNPADSVHVCGCDRPAFQNGRDRGPEPLPAGRNKGEIPQFRVHCRPNFQGRYRHVVHFLFQRVNGDSARVLVHFPTNSNQPHSRSFFLRGLFLLFGFPAIAPFARVQMRPAMGAFPVRLSHDNHPFLSEIIKKCYLPVLLRKPFFKVTHRCPLCKSARAYFVKL